MILVTGATGQMGKAAIDLLLKKIPADQIIGLIRDPKKAEDLIQKGIEVRKGDYFDYSSLLSAFKGVDKLFLISSGEIQDRSKQHINAINAAKEAGVKHIVYTSFQRKSETDSAIQVVAQSHIDTENYLKASGIKYTILKNTLYADILPMFFGSNVIDTGIFLPAGAGKAAFATRMDLTEAAVNVLLGEGHENNEYELSSDTSYSFSDIADILSRLSGKQVVYTDAPVEVYIDAVTKAGVPMEYAQFFAGFSTAIKAGEFDHVSPTMEKLLGRKPVSMTEYLKTVLTPTLSS